MRLFNKIVAVAAVVTGLTVAAGLSSVHTSHSAAAAPAAAAQLNPTATATAAGPAGGSSGLAVGGSALSDPDVHASYTRGFDIHNLSSNTLRLQSSTKGDGDSGPNPGDTILPGRSAHFEVVWLYGKSHTVKAVYRLISPAGANVGVYQPAMTVVSELAWTRSDSTATISRGQSVIGGGNQLHVLDAAGATITLPAGQGQQQAEALNQLCDNNPRAVCTFTPNSRVKTTGPSHTVNGVVFNNTPDSQDGSRTFEDSVQLTHNIEVTAAVNVSILKIVDASVSATYGHSWSKTHTFTTTEYMTIRPYWKGWLEARQPIIRDTGEFTITLSNTTWKLPGVYFDTPNPDGVGVYVKQSIPMTAQELLDHAPTLAFDPTARATP